MSACATVHDKGRPAIFLSVIDHRRLTAAAINALIETPRIAAGLLEEVDRTEIIPDHALSSDVARLGSWVEYLDGGERRRAQLVLQASSSEALPALSTVGAALVGLRAGETIKLPDRLGAVRCLTLLSVEPGNDASAPFGKNLRRTLRLAALIS